MAIAYFWSENGCSSKPYWAATWGVCLWVMGGVMKRERGIRIWRVRTQRRIDRGRRIAGLRISSWEMAGE